MYRILLVDDDAKNLKATQTFLKSHGYDVETTTSPLTAIEMVKAEEFALALLDFQMPEMMGDALATMIRQVCPHQQMAMYSCDLTREAVKTSLKAGAVDFIEKTMPTDEFLKAIEGFCNRYEEAFRTIRTGKNKSENRLVVESVGMVGQSKPMADLALMIKKLAAASDTSVLIRGESGTGKELIARALHKLSSRAGYPFIAINCAAIPKDLLESELFGHVKGAFTGAADNKEGKFKLANGGTIFLDEIGDMPLELQAKLLRVIQERVVEPVGSKVSQKIDVRILSATHKNLDEMAAKKLFREDLIYRLRVIEVEAPPLRSRPEDIEPLVEHFSAKYNKKNGTNKYFQRRTLEYFKRFPWPGNVRELETTIERHIILVSTPDNMIRPENIERKFYEAQPASFAGLTLGQFRLNHSREFLGFLEGTVELAEGNKAEAARRLGIKSNHLNELLKDTRNKVETLSSAT
jgi:two-component system response regulator HydG